MKIAELEARGYCVLRGCFAPEVVGRCRDAFWPVLMHYLERNREQPNRGPHRHFLPAPFDPPCFAPEFFFDAEVLRVVRGTLGGRVVADQWGCDVPVKGSVYQDFHVDYARPLFEEKPELRVPPYMLVVSFPLEPVGPEQGPMEILPGSHRQPACAAQPEAVTLDAGDVLIRHPWTLHRGTPNRAGRPRPLLSIRYVRPWYWDDSREVCAIPSPVWEALTAEQRKLLRFPRA